MFLVIPVDIKRISVRKSLSLFRRTEATFVDVSVFVPQLNLPSSPTVLITFRTAFRGILSS